MPHPDEQQRAANEAIGRMFGPISQPDLAGEVVALRLEIAALRAELAPATSLILTGREVLDQFKKLKATK